VIKNWFGAVSAFGILLYQKYNTPTACVGVLPAYNQRFFSARTGLARVSPFAIPATQFERAACFFFGGEYGILSHK